MYNIEELQAVITRLKQHEKFIATGDKIHLTKQLPRHAKQGKA